MRWHRHIFDTILANAYVPVIQRVAYPDNLWFMIFAAFLNWILYDIWCYYVTTSKETKGTCSDTKPYSIMANYAFNERACSYIPWDICISFTTSFLILQSRWVTCIPLWCKVGANTFGVLLIVILIYSYIFSHYPIVQRLIGVVYAPPHNRFSSTLLIGF